MSRLSSYYVTFVDQKSNSEKRCRQLLQTFMRTLWICAQNYYGIAIRQNVGDLQSMKKAIHATYLHVASSEKNVWHDHCPKGATSWCKYQRSKVDETVKYKPGPSIPMSIVLKHLRPSTTIWAQMNCYQNACTGKRRTRTRRLTRQYGNNAY